MKKIIFITTCLLSFLLMSSYILPQKVKPLYAQKPPTLRELNSVISKAQGYYDGLYVDLGKNGAVMSEYYPKIKYTMRHATIGGYYYYLYTGNATRSAQLKKTILTHGFNPDFDQHSFIWKNSTLAPENIVYTTESYRDCEVTLPKYNDIKPYRSKVCILGKHSAHLYIAVSQLDTFTPMIDTLVKWESGKTSDTTLFENRFTRLGFGIPISTFNKCDHSASLIRSAHFGEIVLRSGKMQYADTIAHYMIKAQNKSGAFYTTYAKDGTRTLDKSLAYKVLDILFNDREAYKGDIVTNAETMNNALAFLLHYRCQRYNEGC
jgi:hypothetical protein